MFIDLYRRLWLSVLYCRPPGVAPEYTSAPPKPLPPPKAGGYKPVPPPKPKHYRPPGPAQTPAHWQTPPPNNNNNNNNNVYNHTKSYSMADNNNYSSHLHNGVSLSYHHLTQHSKKLSCNFWTETDWKDPTFLKLLWIISANGYVFVFESPVAPLKQLFGLFVQVFF